MTLRGTRSSGTRRRTSSARRSRRFTAANSLTDRRSRPGAPSGGFFYDSYMGDVPFNTAMAVEVEKAVKKVCDAKQPFERVVVSKADGAPRRPCRCARAQPRQRCQIRPALLADLSLRARAIRRQHSSSLRTIRSRWRSSRRSCPTTRRPQYTATDRSSTCARAAPAVDAPCAGIRGHEEFRVTVARQSGQ